MRHILSFVVAMFLFASMALFEDRPSFTIDQNADVPLVTGAENIEMEVPETVEDLDDLQDEDTLA